MQTAARDSVRHSRRAVALTLLWLACACDAFATDEPLRVIYPRSESSKDARTAYPLAILQLALEHSGREFHLQPSAATMQQSRSLRLLALGTQLDVVWTVTSVDREARLRPIRVPIARGLIGWRVLLIRRGDAARFAEIDSLASLGSLLGGQGHDWPDVPILRDNGLQVATSTTYEGLFAMLARGHIDYFPRGIDEVADELRTHAKLPIELEPRLLLHYVAPLYFFVHPNNDALAAALEQGLERSLQDGSLKARFDSEYARQLADLHVKQRRVLELANPTLTAATPLGRRELWFAPAEMP